MTTLRCCLREAVCHRLVVAAPVVTLLCLSVIAFGPAASASADPGPVVRIDVTPSLRPAVQNLPSLSAGGPGRRVLRVAPSGGSPADFVAGELIVSARDRGALHRIARRLHARIVKTVDPRTAGIKADPVSLLRIDTRRAPTAGLSERLRSLGRGARGRLRISSRSGLRLLAAAAAEAQRGTRVGINWLTQPQAFEDRTTTEAPTGEGGYVPNAFSWTYMRAAFPSLGAAEAWRTLSIANKLDNKVDIAILDGGFKPNADFPAGTSVLSVVPGVDGLGQENLFQGSKPWHGTNVAEVAAAVPDNGFGVAGPAGPVARLHLVYTTGDMFMGINAVLTAVADGADILNMSYSLPVPATLSFSVLPFEAVTEGAYLSGHLLFASAGNDADDVDAEDCFGVCWEEEWYAPCENAGVICVGGLSSGSDWRDPNSNWGEESCESKFCNVDIFGPYYVWKGPDPDAPQNAARLGRGTSYSSPYVAGVAALIWAADPDLSAKQVRKILFSTAAGSPDPTVDRVVNAAAAVRRALGSGNVAPKVTITAPSPGTPVPYGGLNLIDLKASAVDVEPGCCTITWSSDKDGFLGAGASVATTLGKLGTHIVTATATDSGGATATASIPLTAVNLPPTPKITAPGRLAFLLRNVPYTIAGEASDPNQSGKLPCSALKWTSSNAGDSAFPATGCQLQATFTTFGPRIITLTATDEKGQTAKTTRSFNVQFDPPPQSPPFVDITNPAAGASLDPGTPIKLTATATDPDGSTELSYEWSVKVGTTTKVLGTTKEMWWTPGHDVSFNCGGATATLTFKATDPDGTGSASVPIAVRYEPC
jgi:hypothetical protein